MDNLQQLSSVITSTTHETLVENTNHNGRHAGEIADASTARGITLTFKVVFGTTSGDYKFWCVFNGSMLDTIWRSSEQYWIGRGNYYSGPVTGVVFGTTSTISPKLCMDDGQGGYITGYGASVWYQRDRGGGGGFSASGPNVVFGKTISIAYTSRVGHTNINGVPAGGRADYQYYHDEGTKVVFGSYFYYRYMVSSF